MGGSVEGLLDPSPRAGDNAAVVTCTSMASSNFVSAAVRDISRKETDNCIDRGLPPVLSTCPLHTNSGSGNEWRIVISIWWPAKAAPVWSYLGDYWPCTGGLSAVNVIGTQLRDPINSGLTRWRMAV